MKNKLIRAAAIAGVLSAMSIQAHSDDGTQPSSSVATYGDWAMSCNLLDQTDDQGVVSGHVEVCELKATVSIKADNGDLQPVVQLAIGQLPGNEDYTMVVQVPADVMLREPVGLVLDPPEDDAADQPDNLVQASYVRCTPDGCIADTTLTPAQFAKIAKAKVARVSFINFQQTRIGILVSLKGFKDAADAMAAK